MQRIIQALDTISHLEVVQRFIQTLDTISRQEVVITMTCANKPEHHACSWKELAEAHLRERVSNPHNYRGLSIELYAMEKAGYEWRREFSSYGELSRFLSSLYSCDVNKLILRNRIDDLDEERNKYVIEDAFSYWYNVIPNFYTK